MPPRPAPAPAAAPVLAPLLLLSVLRAALAQQQWVVESAYTNPQCTGSPLVSVTAATGSACDAPMTSCSSLENTGLWGTIVCTSTLTAPASAIVLTTFASTSSCSGLIVSYDGLPANTCVAYQGSYLKATCSGSTISLVTYPSAGCTSAGTVTTVAAGCIGNALLACNLPSGATDDAGPGVAAVAFAALAAAVSAF